MLFLCYPKCSTCKKAQAFLNAQEQDYTLRNITSDRPTVQELKTWQGQSGLPLRRFFNTSGLLYRSLGLKDRLPTMSEDEQLQLLSSDGMLVKRPLLIDGPTTLVGFREQEWAAHLHKSDE